jgi:parallel beta-helix repeat protein
MSQPAGRPPGKRVTALPASGSNNPQAGSPSVSPASSNSPPAGPGLTAQKGQMFGQYRVLAKIGEGGMGAVYRAVHVHLDKTVALKILPPNRLQNQELLARFQREMKAVGRVEHPNIVRALDAGQVGNAHYLAMEYVDGLDVAKIVRKTGPLPVPEACEIIRQAALGLTAIHAHGLVHRDIKPGNLMLARQPVGPPIVKILDLGLARLSDMHCGEAGGIESLTASNVIVGTLDYMAPEQASHQAVDIRADIYSLGATLYTLLTGKPPFSGPQYDSLISKLRALAIEEPPPIQTLRDDVPYELALVIERMMAKDPNARFSTPQEVVAALEPFCAGADLVPLLDGKLPQRSPAAPVAVAPPIPVPGTQTLSASPVTTEGVGLRELIGRRPRRNVPPWVVVAGVLGAGTVLLVLLTAFFLLRGRRAPEEEAVRPPAKTSPTSAQTVNMPAPGTKPTSPPGQRKPVTWIIGRNISSIEEALSSALDGDTIQLPAGQYALSATLVLNKRITLRGDGQDRTVVYSKVPGECVRVTASGVQIQNLTLEYTGDKPANIVAVTGQDCTISECGFRGARAVRTPGIPPVSHGAGVRITDGASASINNCSFRNNERVGVAVINAAKAQITANTFAHCFDGVLFLKAGEGLLENNRCRDCSATGILIVDTGEQVFVTRNTCAGNLQGIYIRDSVAILDGNDVSNNKLHGFIIRGPNKPTLRRNIIQNNGGYGVYCEGVVPNIEPNNIFSGNKSGDVFPRGILQLRELPQSPARPPVASSEPSPPQPTQEEQPGKPRVIRTWQVGKDAATLEDAVQKAQAGDIVLLPEGKLELARELVIDKALTLRGAGRDKTHVISTAANFGIQFTGQGPWTVENIQFTHTGNAPADVLLVSSGALAMNECGITGGKKDETSPNRGHGLNVQQADAISVNNCVVKGVDSIGILIVGQERGQYTITSCSVENCERGIVISSGKFQITKSTVEKCRNVGILIRGESTTGQVEGSIIRGNGSYGVEVSGRARAGLHKNQAIANALHGLAVYDEADVHTEGNVCTGNGHYGIEYHNDAKGLCRDNTCTQNSIGIGLGMRTTARVQNNVCKQNKMYGIWVRDFATPIIEKNSCLGNGVSGIACIGQCSPTIAANRCMGNYQYGIHIGDSAKPKIAKDNILTPNGAGPINRAP